MKKLAVILFILLGFHIYHMDAADTITIVAPTGGESINTASTYNIQWTSTGVIEDVKIEYSVDGGSSWNVITYATDNDGAYDWNVPYTTSTNCLVRISDLDNIPKEVGDTFSIIDDGVDRIRVISPALGDTLEAGSSHEITWQSTGAVGNVGIYYSTDNGTLWESIAASTDNDGSYEWTVPAVFSDYLVKISDGTSEDTSDTFSVVDAGSNILNLTFPNGGETLPGGFIQKITWESSGSIAFLTLKYSIDSGINWNVIPNSSSLEANDGSFLWTLPNTPSANCLVKIKDAQGDTEDESYNEFSIIAAGTPTVNVISPNGGEIYSIGSTKIIRWKSIGGVGDVKIKYSTNNGTSWIDITASTSNTGSYTWKIPNTPSSQCLVRISDASDDTPADTSHAVFTIQSPQPSLAITSPQNGDSWQVGSNHEITWKTHLTVGNVKLEYSTDNQTTWTTITSSTANDGAYSWTVPNKPSTTCNVRISEAADGIPSNTSFGLFSIVAETPDPVISLSHTNLYFGDLKSSNAKTGTQRVIVNNSGGGILRWEATIYDPDPDDGLDVTKWLRVDNISGTQSGYVDIWVSSTMGLDPGTYTGAVKITDPDSSNSPQTINVTLKVYPTHGDTEPFGKFETPVQGSTVMGSIPVTGWVLDDIGIDKVTLWRGSLPGGGGDLAYIGDAVMIDGARSDVEQAFPGYPMNYKAGWGYMMLTNMLPNGGNGTYKLYVYAKDLVGHEVLLGSKTINCDNAHAVKPFGAIDTPAQGGEASGSSFRNHGWVLTPMPNKIPEDGSTLMAYIDGQYIGQPRYKSYREDIATLFPGYANSSAAGAYFDFDTTNYESGVHTIYWTAADNAGNADGIGSRFFTIQNSGYNTSEKQSANSNDNDIPAITFPGSKAVMVKTGYAEKDGFKEMPADKKGMIHIVIPGDQRVVVYLNQPRASSHTGYMVVNRLLRPLPAGSSMDRRNGIFYWQPGPAFIGTYNFVFISKDQTGKPYKRNVTIKII